MTTAEQENKELVRQFYEALNDDKEAALSLLADDLRIGENVVGGESWMDSHWENFVEPMSEADEPVEWMIAEDDMVGVRWRYVGKHTEGPFMGIPPTGEELESTGHNFYRIEDGEIVQVWAQWNFNAIFQALDLLPESMYELRIRQQLLEVLLRVLRHNISNDLNTISGMAELIADGDVPTEEFIDRIQTQANQLQSTAAKVRNVERAIVHEQATEVISLTELVGTAMADHRDRYPEANIGVSVHSDNLVVEANRTLIRMVLDEAIENAVLHADSENPIVNVTVETSEASAYEATIEVADDGPGIPDHELKPIERGREDPLEHASGIGLWAIKWGMDLIGGEVEFDENDPQGSIVRFHIPESA